MTPKTGTKKATYRFRDDGFRNDFIPADGTVHATDSELGRIIRLKPRATAPDVWAGDPGLVGSDGIAFAPGKLHFNNVRKNLLRRIEINADGSSGAVTPLQLSAQLSGPDGMRVGPGNVLLITENRTGKLTQAKVEGDEATLTTIKVALDNLPPSVLSAILRGWRKSKFALRNDANSRDPPRG